MAASTQLVRDKVTTGMEIPPFPYKREFIDPEELWKNAVSLDLVRVEVITLPKDMNSWRSIPRGFEWKFQGETVAFVTTEPCYSMVNKLVDYFSEEARMHASRKDRMSPYDYYMTHYPEILTQAQQYQSVARTKGDDRPLKHWLREAVYLNGKGLECTTFKIAVTKALFRYFGSKVVLDPSAGWGDRCLGAAAAGVTIYHGVDPNPRLRKAYDEMIGFIHAHNPELQYSIVSEDFLKVELTPGSYDTIFTSPPFFDFEIYSDDPKQSVHGRGTIDKWTNEFFYPYLRKAWDALATGGYFIIYMSDTKAGKYASNMHQFVTKDLKGNFLGIIALTDEEKSYGYPIWCWRK